MVISTVALKKRLGKKAIFVYKLDKCCNFCGYKEHPEILQFHHIEPDTKAYNIHEMGTLPWVKVLQEINKCVLLCPNCHTYLHYKETAYNHKL
jgi:hypothetical protein